MTKHTKLTRILTIAISCVVFVCVCILIFEFIKIANLKSTNNKLQSNLNEMQQQIYDYSVKNAYYSDREAYLEQYAREVLNWGKSDRTYYVSK